MTEPGSAAAAALPTPGDTVPSPALSRLAEMHQVATDYWDWQGRHVIVSAETIRTVLAALGVDASSDQAAEAAMREAEDAPWRRILPPTVVSREGWTPWVPMHVPNGSTVGLWIDLENGERWHANQVDNYVPPRWVDGREIGRATFELPWNLPLGWHTLVAEIDGRVSDDSSATATLVVTPQRLPLPRAIEHQRVWGLMAQLYQVRSSSSWGIGDLADLADLAVWGGHELDADFVLVNPLHAAEPIAPMEPSPYLPTTRRFANPLYLRVEDIPEVAYLPPHQRAEVERLAAEARELTTSEIIDRDGAWRAKRAALEIVFAHGLQGRRQRGLAAYARSEGEGLTRFATWCALADVYGLPWTHWPAELQNPDSEGVAQFQRDEADRIEFHNWLQWQLETQLASVQREATAAGMGLGIVHDLAVGVHQFGADAWGLGDALAQGVTVGAPPDQFNQLGQNWNQPPWRAGSLADLGYQPYRDMLRTVLRDSGGIRVDHVIGLFRLWWIPAGQPATEGTYVRYDHEALVGILVLEAARAGAVVVGEDLGVVEPMAREYLAERGVLGTSIMWFEFDREGKPLRPESYRDLCLSSVTTHDLPPTAGYLGLEHVELRERLGLLTRPVEQEREVERQSIEKFRDMLANRGLAARDADVEETVFGLHRLIGQTPSRMIGVAVTDLVGDRKIINQPGTENEYPNWRLPLSGPDGLPLLLDDVVAAPLARKVAQALA